MLINVGTIKGMFVGRLHKLLLSAKFVINHLKFEGYFPDQPRHNLLRLIAENYRWSVRNGAVNEYYFFYGMDRRSAGINMSDYLSYKEHMKNLEAHLKSSEDSKKIHELTQDKSQFNRMADLYRFRVPKIIANVADGMVERPNGSEKIQISDFFDSKGDTEMFCKPVIGMKGEGIFMLSKYDGQLFKNGEKITVNEVSEIFKDTNYLLQEIVEQHPLMENLHASSLNTMRLITVAQGKAVTPFVASLRIGRGGSRADNWRLGGLVVRVDLTTGTLTGYALPKPGSGPAMYRHPDTNILFEGYEIPHFSKAVNSACEFHNYMGCVSSIAWDIAFTPEGVCFIEANVRWGSRTHLLLEPNFKQRYLELF